MKVLQGDDIIILVDGKPTFHADNHKLTISPDKKERRTKDTDGREFSIGDINFTATGNGLGCVRADGDTADAMDTPDLLDLVLAKKRVEIILKNTQEGERLTSYKGGGYITSLDIDSPAGEDVKYSYTVEGSGLVKVPE